MNPDWQVRPGNDAPTYAAALAAGVPAIPQVLAAGGTQATGVLTFAGQPVAADTLTINGITYTFVASGGTGHNVTIGVSTAATITALEAAYTSAADAANAGIVLSTVGSTIVVTAPHYSADGNVIKLSETSANITVTPYLTGGVSVEADLNRRDTVFVSAATTAQHVTLKNGLEGQEHCFVLDSIGGGGSFVVHINGYTHTITFNTAGQVATVRYLNGLWRVFTDTGSYA